MNNNRLQTAKNSLRGLQWVLSGSMAMKLYGNKYGVPTRQPANVNIIVNKNNMNKAYNALYILVPPRRIPRNTTHPKTKIHYNLNQYDLLRAKSNLAPSINSWVNLNGIPVVSLENLLKYKTIALNNVPRNNKKGQIVANIKTLENLIKKKGPLTVKHSWSPRSPTTTRSPRTPTNRSPRTPRTPRTPTTHGTPRTPKRLFMNSPQ